MKLWVLVDLLRIPHVFSKGLDNPYCEEIIFHTTPHRIAETAQDYDGHLAFLQVDFAEEDLDDWFTMCMESHDLDLGYAQDDLRAMIDSGEYPEDILNARTAEVQAMVDSLDSYQGSHMLAAFGYACMYTDVVVPPEMIQMLDPATMLEAVLTNDQAAIIEAAETAEVRGLESMGANFWVWLIMFMAGLFGPNWGAHVEAEETARKAEARRSRRKCPVRTKKRARKKKAKKKRRTVKA